MTTNFTKLDNVQEWACATIQEWSAEVLIQQRLRKNRDRTARYRMRKNFFLAEMLAEHQHLEETMTRHLVAIRAKSSDGEGATELKSMAIQQLAVEREELTSDNRRLQEELLKHITFQTMINSDCLKVVGLHQDVMTDDEESQGPRIRTSRWIAAPPTSSRYEEGWRVFFTNGSPSFYFHPFSRDEFDSILKHCDDTLVLNPPHIQIAGSLFGWDVHHAPPTRRTEDNSIVAHARFTRRVRCSLHDADKMLDTLDVDAWPILVTPEAWGYDQRGQTCCQVLQEFDTDAYVLVRDIPGTHHLRYVIMARRCVYKQANGKTVGTYAMVIAHSEANARSQAVEQPSDVDWSCEGGTYIKFTEVDETTIDVTYDHWASCQNELHAQLLFVRWAEFAVWLQQWVLPTQLLSC